MNNEDEQWRLMHILRGHTKLKHCDKICSDVLCLGGCLNQQAKLFRPEIMHGVKLIRESGSNKFPLTVLTAVDSRRACSNSKLGVVRSTDKFCDDPVCTVTGCLDVPAFYFREIIKIAREEELLEALKK